MADGSVYIDTKIDQESFAKQLGILSSLASGAIAGLTKVLAGAAAGLGTLGVAAVKLGSDFEAQMARVLAISDAAEDEFVAMTALAKELGASTAFSASEAAAGMENLASAGFTAQQIMAAMPGLLDLAAVSGGDVAAAAEVAASALNAFGLGAEMAGHVANVFAKAAADTNAECLDMGDAMKYVAPVAAAMCISLEETAAAIGIMSDAGIKGSQAGTALRGALTRIAKPTEIMQETMQALGISFYDAEGNMLSLKDQVTVLQDAFVGLSQEQRNQALVTLYGQESLSGMLALIEAGPEELEALTQSLKDSEGAAQKMAETINDTLKGDIDGLMGSLETLGIAFYQSISDPLKNAVRTAEGYVNQLTKIFEAEGLGGLASGIGNILSDAVTSIADSGPAMIEAAADLVSSFAEGIAENAPALLEAAVNIGLSFVDGLISMGESIFAVGAEFLVQIISGITDNLPSLAQSAMDAVNGFVDGVETNLPIILEKGSEMLLSLTSGIAQNLPSLVSQGLDALMRFATTLRENAPTLVQTGFDMLSQLVQGILNCIPDLLSKAPKVISEFANVINDNFPVILLKGAELLWQIITGLIGAIPDLVAAVPSIISAFIDVWSAFNWVSLGKNAITFLKDGMLKLVGAIKGAGKTIADTVLNAIAHLPQTLGNLGKNAMSFFKSGITGMTNSIVAAAKGIFTGVVNTLKGLPGQMVTLAGNIKSGIINALKDLPQKMTSLAKDMITGLWNGITSKTDWIIGKIKSFGGAVLKGLKDFFGIKSPSTVMRDIIGANLALGVAEGVDRNADKAVDAMQNMADDMSDVDFDDIVANVGGTIRAGRATTAEAVTASTTSAIYRAGSTDTTDDETPDRDGSNPQYIENNIYIDGKKTARVLTPYISERQAFEK